MIRINTKKTAGCLYFFLILLAAAALRFSYSAQDAMPLLDRISEKLNSYPKLETWNASVISTVTEMDKNWNPQEVVVITKNVKVINGERDEEILKALETKKGKTTDVTAKYINEARKEREKAEKEKSDKKNIEGEKEGGSQGLEMSSEDLFPFAENKRIKYDFVQLEDESMNGRPVRVLESRAKVKNPEIWEGKYYIDRESFDILKIDIKPSKNPKMVKDFEMEISFELLENGSFVVKKSKVLINGGIFIKHIRMVIEEEYSDFKIID